VLQFGEYRLCVLTAPQRLGNKNLVFLDDLSKGWPLAVQKHLHGW
jgi:hypothetical protein